MTIAHSVVLEGRLGFVGSPDLDNHIFGYQYTHKYIFRRTYILTYIHRDKYVYNQPPVHSQFHAWIKQNIITCAYILDTLIDMYLHIQTYWETNCHLKRKRIHTVVLSLASSSIIVSSTFPRSNKILCFNFVLYNVICKPLLFGVTLKVTIRNGERSTKQDWKVSTIKYQPRLISVHAIETLSFFVFFAVCVIQPPTRLSFWNMYMVT